MLYNFIYIFFVIYVIYIVCMLYGMYVVYGIYFVYGMYVMYLTIGLLSWDCIHSDSPRDHDGGNLSSGGKGECPIELI